MVIWDCDIHILDLGKELELTIVQKENITVIYNDMKKEKP